MIATVVLQNLAYLIGAVVLIVIGALVVTLRHRKPKSVEANMASFHKGLRALSPESQPVRRRHAPVTAPTVPAKPRSVHTVLPSSPAAPVAANSGPAAPGPVASDPAPVPASGRHPGPGDDTTTEAETG